jgi:hypothetical protein
VELEDWSEVALHNDHNSSKIYSQKGGLLKLDAVDAVDALHPHLLKLDAVHPVIVILCRNSIK